MNNVYILLGANLGSPLMKLAQATELLINKLGNLKVASSIYQSEAWGIEDQPIFYNQVLLIETSMDMHQTLHICQDIENQLGRVREIKWGSRTIDIDILYFNNEIITEDKLTIPHPYIHQRNFTLVPLVEIAKDYIHPIFKVTNEQLLLNCTDHLAVNKINDEHGI